MSLVQDPEGKIQPSATGQALVPRRERPRDTDADVLAQTVDSEVSDFNLGDLVDFVYRRRWWMIATVAAIMILGMAWTLTRPPLYSSKVQILVTQPGRYSGGSGDDLSILKDLAGATATRNIPTQMQILRSPDLLNLACKRLRERDEKILQTGFHSDEPDLAPFLTVQNAKDTDIITVTVNAFHPEAAKQMVQCIAETYQEQSKDQSREAMNGALKFVDDQLQTVGAERDAALRDLADYKGRKGIVDIDASLAERAKYVAALEADVANADRAVSEAAVRVTRLAGELQATPETVQAAKVMETDPRLIDLNKEITRLENQRTEQLALYTESSKEIKDIDGQIADAKQRAKGYLTDLVSSTTVSVNKLHEELSAKYVDAKVEANAASVRLASVQGELAKQKEALERLPRDEMEISQKISNVQLKENTYNLLSQQRQMLSISKESRLSNVSIVESAKANRMPVSPDIKRNIAVFLLLGIMLAIGVAFMLEALDDRIHSQEALERLSGRPVLAHIPRVQDEVPQLIDYQGRPSSILESTRLLRSNLMYASMDGAARVLLMTSSAEREGKSTMSLNLAISLAMDGKRVVIVDADLRRPSLHTYLNMSREVGLTSVLTGQATLESALQTTSVPGLHLLSTGPLPPNPPEVLNAAGTRNILGQLAEQFDMVIIDAPPAVGLSDVSVLARLVDGVLLVVCMDESHRRNLRIALRTLEQVEAPLFGFILNKLQTTPGRSGYYYYYYYYTPEHSGESRKKHRGRRRGRHGSSGGNAAQPNTSLEPLDKK